jgi:hypothetical protein
MRRISRVIAAAACGTGAALGVASCGHQAVLKPGHPLTVALMEYRLRPNHIVAPGGHLRITVQNDGRLSHNLVIVQTTPTTTVATTPTGTVSYATTVAARAPDLPPGASTTITVALAPGRYGISSTLDADDSLGAQGTLTVTSK